MLQSFVFKVGVEIVDEEKEEDVDEVDEVVEQEDVEDVADDRVLWLCKLLEEDAMRCL